MKKLNLKIISGDEVPSATRRFLKALYRGQSGLLEVRYIYHDKEAGIPARSKFLPGIQDLDWTKVTEMNRAGFHAFFGAALRATESGTKQSVEQVGALWADLDGKDFDLNDIERGKQLALERLGGLPPELRPSARLDTGGGYHVYWFLKSPESVLSAEQRARVESAMRRLKETLKGDHVQNVDRILRLPGSLNVKKPTYPNPWCRIIAHDFERRFSLEDFESLADKDPRPAPEGNTKPAVTFSTHAISLELAAIQAGSKTKTLIEEGWSAKNGYKSRSEADQAVITALAQGGHTDDEIRAVFSNAAWGIGAKYRERGAGGDAYLARSIANARSLVGTPNTLSSLTSLLSRQETVKWPKDLNDRAFYGLAGEVVRTLEPHTEADPAALLLNFMVAFGNVVSDKPHLRIGSDRHPIRLNAVLVGATSKARKGTSWSPIRELLAPLDLGWSQNQIVEGLSSGEGLIYAVRDAQFKEEPVKEKKRVVEYERVRTDPGVTDKRLLVIESEFGRTLKTMGRDGNTLSAVIRQAWDNGNLNVLTKNNPVKATGAHISIVGHITSEELLRNLDSTEAANGFANRFIWMAVKRSKCLPEGGWPEDTQLKHLRRKLERVMRFAERVKEMTFSKPGLILWHIKYRRLSEGKPGLVGLMTGRAEAQVLRMACLYALLDRSALVKAAHIRAALAVWRRAEASVRYIFGERLGDSVADSILAAIRERGSLTQLGISNLFQRHQSADRIARSLLSLQKAGLIRMRQEKTGGRPETIWEYAGAKEAKEAK